jgi:ComF family protein
VIWSVLLDALFPPRCVGCTRRGVALCDTCRGQLPYLPRGVCFRCASHRGAYGVCRGCRRLSPMLSRVQAPFAYVGAARNAVLNLKFRSGRYLAPLMGDLLRERLEQHHVDFDVVVPVPLSPKRLRERGFNQAELLAEHVFTSSHVPIGPEVLARGERPSQRTLNASRRLDNLAGAFNCPEPARIAGKRVLLVDDVITTGATVSACADTLADAGARHVCALAFARNL